MGGVGKAIKSGFDELSGEASRKRKKAARAAERAAAEAEAERLAELEEQKELEIAQKKEAAVERKTKREFRKKRGARRSGTLFSKLSKDDKTLLGG